jgi:cell division protease FtsH
MVTQYGMTEAIGAIKLGSDTTQPFMGRDFGHQRDYSENVAAIVDAEIRKLIEHAHHEAYELLVENRTTLDAMVIELLEKETLNKDEISIIFKKIKKRNNRPAWTGSAMRIPSQIPPVAVPARIENAPEETKKRTTRTKKSDA